MEKARLMKHRLWWCGFALLVILAAVVRCAINPVTGQNQLMLISEQEELKIGNETYPNALWGGEGGGGEYKDEQLKQYLGQIVRRVHGISHRPNLPLTFVVQNSSVPNAWAIPGHVAITRGLLAGLDNEAEFAFVMGHEIGHVSSRHSASQMSWEMVTQLGLGLAGLAMTGTDYGDAVIGLGSVGSSMLLLKHSRDDELEADRLGVVYMSKLGYDPRHAVTAHQNLQKISNEYMKSLGQKTQERNFFEDLLSTHPRTQVRIEEIQQIIRNSPPTAVTGDGNNRQQFQAMIAGVKRANQVYVNYYDQAARSLVKRNFAEANNLLNKAITADRSQASFYALEGFVLLRSKNYQEAERYFNGALTLDKNYQPGLRGMGMLNYTRSNLAESVRYLKRSAALFPQDMASRYYLGMSYYKTNNFKQAVPHLAAFAQVKPKHASVHAVLGTCYEKLNDLPSAYKQYSMQLQVAPGSESGRTASSRLSVIKPVLEKQNATKK
ncbi:MAG: TPR repeat-containing protein YfgC precursor [Syntrophorhabdaceae bacterium PtaU1.Bin034]|nr:MAG: TPR repeat-containing protein YfgC precursor [Syntrophorhabdaceae bacterium PtaU1.Bin034]